MDRATLIIALFFIFILGMGVGFYLVRFIF